MASAKKKTVVRKVNRTGGAPKKVDKVGGGAAIPPEVATALATVLKYLTDAANFDKKSSTKVPCDCPNPCQGVPAGEVHVLVCDGTSGQPFPFPGGTANGQVLAWDHTTQKVYWSNV